MNLKAQLVDFLGKCDIKFVSFLQCCLSPSLRQTRTLQELAEWPQYPLMETMSFFPLPSMDFSAIPVSIARGVTKRVLFSADRLVPHSTLNNHSRGASEQR